MSNKSIEKYSLYIYIGSLYNTALMWLESGKEWSVAEISDYFYEKCCVGSTVKGKTNYLLRQMDFLN